MPSFTRRAPASTAAPPSGTVPSPGTPLHLLPTGIPSLDDLFAGGIPLGGTWIVLAPDRHSAWARLVARYWIAQGLCSGQGVVVVGEEDGAREVVEGCMWLDPRFAGEAGEGAKGGSESEGEGVGDDVGEGKGGKKIAWRYDGMSKFKTTVGSSNHLTLTKTIPAKLLGEMEKGGQLSYIPLQHPNASAAGPSRRSNWPILEKVLQDVKEKVSSAPKGKAARFMISELGGSDWGDVAAREIHRFLHSLRAILKSSSGSALVTLPAELARSPPNDWNGDLQAWIQSLSWAVDASVEFRGFGDSPSLAPLYAPLHGLLTLHSFPTSHSLLPPSIRHSTLLGISTSASSSSGGYGGGGAGENNLGFRCSRKRLEIETVHLGIEGGTGERRTEPVKDVGGVIGAPPPSLPSNSGGSGAEAEAQSEGVDKPKPPAPAEVTQVEKPKKARRAVRFGGPEVEVGANTPSAEADHQHQHHQHHQHDHSSPAPAGRPRIRHDKPELYDF